MVTFNDDIADQWMALNDYQNEKIKKNIICRQDESKNQIMIMVGWWLLDSHNVLVFFSFFGTDKRRESYKA